MTSQKDKIQSLIADIGQVLDTQRPKKPWVRASDMEPQRQALAKVQEYLQSLQQSFDAPDGWGPVDPATGQLIPPDKASADSSPSADSSQDSSQTGIFSGQPTAPGSAPEDVLQSLLTEMKFLRSSALEPLRLEMDSLRQERDGLQQEVKGLEAQRSALQTQAGAATVGRAPVSDEQLNEFLAVLMERLQERLSTQVTQTLGQLESNHAEAIAKLAEATDAEVLQLRPAGQSIEEMRELQSRSDQLLVNIESTLQGMYETLQKNIDSYQISLNEGIENMHSLGRQGEVIVRSLVDHLTHQLGQTAPPEPAFFPSRSATQGSRSSLTYALTDSPTPDLSDSETLPTAEAVTAAIATVSETEENADDTVSSLNEILPEGSFDETAPDETAFNRTVFEEESSAPIDQANQMDIGVAATGNIAATEDSKRDQSDPTEQAADTGTETATTASEIAPEDCIREDGTIDLDLLKLDIDRADDDLTAEDVMIDAAIADAQVAAAEAEDPEIEAKVTPTPEAAYLAELTLDDLTSVEDFTRDEVAHDNLLQSSLLEDDLLEDSRAEEADSATADEPDLASVLPDLGLSNSGDTFPDVNTGEPLFPDIAPDTSEDANWASLDVQSNVQSDTQSDTQSKETADKTSAMAAAALGAAAAVNIERISETEASSETSDNKSLDNSEDQDIWDSSVTEGPDSAKVPDIPDAQDEKPAETDTSTAVDDTVSDELAAQLEADSLRADQIAASAVRAGLEAVSTLTPDLEEPIVSEENMPEPSRLSEEAEPMESSQIPDWPEEENAETTNQIEDSAEPDQTSNEALVKEESGEATRTESIPDLSVAAAAAAAATATVATASQSEEPSESEASEVSPSEPSLSEAPQFVDEDPFGTDLVLEDSTPEDLAPEDLASENLASENLASEDLAPELETNSDSEPAPDTGTVIADFDDDLDFFETSDVADQAADDLIEKLSIESFDDEETSEAAIAEFAQSAVTEDMQPIEGLAEFPELPVIAPPLPDVPIPDVPIPNASTPATEDADSAAVENNSFDDELDDGEDDPTDGQSASWFLGIDLGTTGLSAVLINRLGEQVYPLYWHSEADNLTADSETNAGEEQYGIFRLPVVLQIEDLIDGGEATETRTAETVSAVGLAALQSEQPLRTVKPLLKVGIPQNDANGPLIQWSDHNAIPLRSIQAALTQLLSTLSPQNLDCGAINLKKSALRRILRELEGVAIGYPNNWPDTYSFNVREAVLAAGIVSAPDQIFFVEEAIAALLSALPDPQVELDEADSRQPSLYNCNWQGGTVVISAGATLTEAGVVDIPSELDQLIYRDFALRSFTYAGDSLDQDIICQLLHAPIRQAASDDSPSSGWDSLGLNQLQLPQAGEADRIKRHRLRQRLNDSQLGREVTAAARDLKMVLQEETQCELTLAGQSWVVKRKDLETKVFIPYIQRINRQINSLLNQKGLSAQSIKQVICTGGSAALGAIARWLRQKFPNATIIQDTYSGEYSNSCSRVAYGLANLCNYPLVLDAHRHQYNDYFLLLELLRVLPDQPLPAGGILHLLEQRGVNIQACQSHILALIEGHLPPGLVPTEGDRPLISAQSPNIETYRTLSELPLFRKQGGQIYIADEAQGDRLRKHLEALLSAKHQTLSEPLAASLATQQSV